MRSVDGKCALITGSVRGLGLRAAHRFAEVGCDLVLNGFEAAQDISALRSDIEDRYAVRTVYSGADLRRPAEIEAMVSVALEAFGGVDIVVNNAVTRHAAPIEAFGTAEWDDGIAVNVSAAFHTIRLTVPGMKQRGWGRIINVSSIYGLRGAVNRVGYVTSKTALIGLTRAVALETARNGITCNAVCPGTSVSPTHEEAIAQMMANEGLSPVAAEMRFLAGKQPTGRLVSAEGVAGLIAFLCTEAAADITGAAIPIDAGWSAN